MTPVELSRTVLCAVRRAVDEGELSVAVPARAVVTPPGPGGCGDYATNIALQLARPAGQPPLRVAEILQRHLAHATGLADVTVTGPGFLNISLRDGATSAAALTREILDQGQAYGHSDTLAGRIITLRIPYDIRAEVVADALTRIIASQGGRTEVEHRKPTNLRPVPASDGPAPLGPHAAPTEVEPLAPVGLPPVPSSGDPGPAPLGPDAAPTEVEPLAPVGLPPVPSSEDPGPAPLGPHAAPTEVQHHTPVDLRPVPAPEDPTPLGPDAARWALLHPAAHDRPRITADHLVQRESNPLFRVRYAYARTRALSRNAADLGFTAEPGDVRLSEPGDGRLTEPPAARLPDSADAPLAESTPAQPPTGPSPFSLREVGAFSTRELGPFSTGEVGPFPTRELGPFSTDEVGAFSTREPSPFSTPEVTPLLAPLLAPPLAPLLTALADHPRVLARAAAHRTPDRLCRHLVTVADAALPFLLTVLPIGEEKPSAAHRARLALAEAVGAVLAGGLSLLGIDAPEHL
ncbi:ArgS-related anticodon-binding protein NrtL [Streptomyces sp. NPDC001617]